MAGSPLVEAYNRLTRLADEKFGWDRLPVPIGLGLLVGIRSALRAHNLYNTWRGATTPRAVTTGSLAPGSPATPEAAAPDAGGAPATSGYLTARTADGTYNDLGKPLMGASGTRFARNVPLRYTYPDPLPAMLDPDPRQISRELMTRERFQPATTLNVLAAAWLQFMIRDWFSHGKSEKENPWLIEVLPDDPWPGDRPMKVLRTRRDPTRTPDEANDPPTYINTETHWWDGSQLYGSDAAQQKRVRAGKDGKLLLDADGMIPAPMLALAAEEPGWWLGLALFHTIFAREHNAICDRLRAEYPSWSDDDLFERARLINAALLAKIHTVEWTPGILSHPTTQIAMHGNWWGLAGERIANTLGRLSQSEVVSGIVGSPTDHHTADYALTEEFVAVYRMHPLTPDDFVFRSAASGQKLRDLNFRELAGKNVQPTLAATAMTDLLYSFGTGNAGAVVLHNFPRFLQEYERPDGILQDLAATDIVRAREQGVPRYNQFRRLLQRAPVTSFAEITDNPVWAEEMRRVYKGDVERVDLMVGLYAERRPEGFGFSETAFRVFALMASRRLKSDRFFTTDFTPGVYTPAGMEWLARNDMSSVLRRHYPALAPALRGVANAFAPWNRLGA